ncbi:3-deoxy-manno-octulosonate cytidylyltransferase, partial [Alcaligenes pakistanensis]
ALLTDAEHPTGTDRLAQAARLLELSEDEIVVNVQGDEPLILPEHINAAAELLARSEQADIATLAAPIKNAETLFNPNAVKVVCDLQGRALYFSRAPMPWARDALAGGEQLLADGLPALHHIGLYAYRNRFLQQYAQLPRGPLEHFESLEQLRAMENGFQIMVHRLQAIPAAGVDTEQDLERVRAHFANRL